MIGKRKLNLAQALPRASRQRAARQSVEHVDDNDDGPLRHLFSLLAVATFEDNTHLLVSSVSSSENAVPSPFLDPALHG